MPGSYNNMVMLKGFVGTEPELVGNGERKISKFRMSVIRKSKGEKVTDWYSILTNGFTGTKVIDTVKKGDRISITGQIVLNEFKTKEGNTRLSVDVWADDVEVLTKLNSNGAASSGGSKQYSQNSNASQQQSTGYTQPQIPNEQAGNRQDAPPIPGAQSAGNGLSSDDLPF